LRSLLCKGTVTPTRRVKFGWIVQVVLQTEQTNGFMPVTNKQFFCT
jgi:hypothetical protein